MVEYSTTIVENPIAPSLSHTLNPSKEDPTSHTLVEFLQEWDNNYNSKARALSIFNPAITCRWTDEQKQYFAKVFYHARGHFHDFLWYLGNHASSGETKKIVLHNIAEELGGAARSHEQLYLDFAQEVGADVSQEFITEEHYLPVIKDFNQGHLEWLSAHDADSQLAAFSAYERLDNIDYVNLLGLVESFGIKKGRGSLFFKIHARVQHFETTVDYLEKIWDNSPYKVEEAFGYIALHQLNMWKALSDNVINECLN